MSEISVIDLGVNNLASLVSSIKEASGLTPHVVSTVDDLMDPKLVVLPGTGSFGYAMEQLSSRGFTSFLEGLSEGSRTFLLGVCLGMQLLFEGSEESPGVRGLGLMEGHIARLNRIGGDGERVPHVGWSAVTIDSVPEDSFFQGLKNRDFYFSHSYAFPASEKLQYPNLVTDFGNACFVSGFARNRLFGFQFHPEKSSAAGLELLSRVIREAVPDRQI